MYQPEIINHAPLIQNPWMGKLKSYSLLPITKPFEVEH